MADEARNRHSELRSILRDFLVAHRELHRVARLQREGALRFTDVARLVGDDEDAVLYRLKERCHRIFRSDGEVVAMRREALLDLAIGALFHECMKFRENFYQSSIYGPKVRALRRTEEPGGSELFEEFERILQESGVRQGQALEEAEGLLRRSATLLRALLGEQPENGWVVRFLLENPEEVEFVFGESHAVLLRELYGSPGAAYEQAGLSYLASGYFADAAHALRKALSQGGRAPELAGLLAYAEGMRAYLEQGYEGAVTKLGQWVEAGAPAPGPAGVRLRELAHQALSRLDSLLGESSELAREAKELAGRVPVPEASG